jgi:hypothetical protein
VCTPLATTFTALFCLRFRLEINSFPKTHIFLLEVSRELTQCSTLNTFFVALSFLVVHVHSLTLFALTFLCVSHSTLLIFVLFQTCHTFINSSILLPYSGFQFLFFVGRVSNKPVDFANFFRPCKHDSWIFDSPVAAAANSQVKLCPYDEEEPHIWFRLIEAQFAAAGIKSQKLKYANTLASVSKQVLRDILDTMGDKKKGASKEKNMFY